MNYFCGTDIIEVERVKNAILKTDSFKEKIFTPLEISYAESSSNLTKFEHYAGRFAAKEAIYKAISKRYPHVYLSEIEIINDKDNMNRPVVNIYNKELSEKITNKDVFIDVSISHIKDFATANAIVEFID